jgi:glycosyltransferase A (GT-A) superfamily protein (DUF2064 family)
MKTSRLEAFDGVPMSVDHTGVAQLERLRELGMSVGLLPELRDVDYFDDARHVATENPEGRFARAFLAMEMKV